MAEWWVWFTSGHRVAPFDWIVAAVVFATASTQVWCAWRDRG